MVAKIATSDGQSYRELQVESNCLCVLWHRAYSTSLCCIRMLRLSALSLQMASQVAALTLLALPASVAARARSAPSVCGGGWGGVGGPSHTTPMRNVAFSPVQAAQQRQSTSPESARTGRLRRFWLWLQIRRQKNLPQRFTEINTSGSTF